MTAATGVSRQAQDYLAAVEHELAGLPADDRSALREDLALHLDALTAEDDDRSLVVRLGPPAAYAADLRSAAGLPASGAGTRPALAGLSERLDRIRATPAARRMAPAARAARRFLADLRPAWWVLRGCLLVLVPCLHESDAVRDFPVPAPLGSNEFGVVLVLVAVAGSVALGRRRLPRPLGVLVAGLGAVLALSAFFTWQWSGVTRGYSAATTSFPAPDRATGEYPLLSR